jgi:RND family efflux transporter MFP subunit
VTALQSARSPSILIGTLISLLFLSACVDNSTDTEENGRISESIPVFQTQAEEVDLLVPIVATGTIAADKTTNITPTISGLVESIHVAVGSHVRQGQLLFKLRQTDIKLRIKQLEHALILSKAEEQDAKRDLQTNIDLARRGAVSQEVLDNIRTRGEIKSAQLGIAEAQLAQARQNLTDTEVMAPYDGVITEKNIDEGAYLQTMRGGSQPALQIQKIDQVDVIVLIPEIHLKQIKVGSAAKIYIDGLDKEFDSQIDIINDRVDHLSRSIEVRLTIPNEDYQIKPGLFARAEIYPQERSAIVIDRQVIRGSTSPYVFISEQGFAKRRTVRYRDLDTQRVEILEGLVAGDKVLSGANIARLTPGAPIRIVEG